MKVVAFYTGQGVIGKLSEMSFYTGQFSTCSPVVMFNENTTMAGVYHLPGCNGTRSKLMTEWATNLMPMADVVNPTHVYLFPSGDASYEEAFGQSSQASKYGDRDKLKPFFEEYKALFSTKLNIVVETVGRTGIYVSAQGKNIQFATALPTSGVDVHDLKTNRKEPTGCQVYNMDIDYSIWM
ncbi:MAG TPA: hypothetical protein VN706_15940 [Gemmatimonadaceae bacterium]|nr:hypothetical protein [Gemmatimonadaceae bacterium]